jgi:hypothetical protein
MDQLQTRLDALEQQMRTMNRRLRWWRGLAGGLLVLAVLTWALPSGTAQEGASTGGEKEKKGLEQRVAALEDLLKHFSREKNEVFITGANLHLVNGLGSTDCADDEGNPIPDCPNGLGNLIVGYNELRRELPDCELDPTLPFCTDTRTGSHNVVVGPLHNFSGVGGLVIGDFHTISGNFASVSGGRFNTASGDYASVSGGQQNTASGGGASVSGGIFNTASGVQSAVCGGDSNTASGERSAVCGGSSNTASRESSAVSGGFGNTASGEFSSINGGGFNPFTEEGIGNMASGDNSSICGGSGNTASGMWSSVSGGRNITKETDFGWAAGSEADEVVVGNFRSP